jgi:colanic acid/amylovoran biosynthesis protein WcaK/AmsJ
MTASEPIHHPPPESRSENKARRFILAGNHCSSNCGDAAILDGLILGLNSAFKEPELSIISNTPDIAQFFHGYPAKRNIFHMAETHRQKLMQIFRNKLISLYVRKSPLSVRFLSSSTCAELDDIRKADAMVCIGGSFLTGVYGHGYFPWLDILETGKDYCGVMAGLGLSCGPFTTKAAIRRIRRFCAKADLITCREEDSWHVLKAIGCDLSRTHLTADTAFLLKPKESPTASLRDKLADRTPFITVSVRHWPYTKKQNAHQEYMREMAQFCDTIIEKQNMSIIFLSTCTGFGGYYFDDRLTAWQIIQRMKHPDRASVEMDELRPMGIIQHLQLSSLHIGTRMHSNIFASIAHTPFVPIQYEHKTAGLMSLLDLEIDPIHIDDLTSDKLLATFASVWDRRDDIRGQLTIKVPDIRRRAQENITLLSQLLDR